MTVANGYVGSGNSQALAQLLNQILAPQATTARLDYQPQRWRILLESQDIPNRVQSLQALKPFFQQVALPPGIEIYGRQAGEKTPAWGVRIKPHPRQPDLEPPYPLQNPGLELTGSDIALPKLPPLERLREPGLFLGSLGTLFAVGAGLWWLSPSPWIAQAPLAAPTQIRQAILSTAATTKPSQPPTPIDLTPPPMFRGHTLTQVPIPGRKVVALTFDDGPDRLQTQQVLTILQQTNVKATFFVIGRNVQLYPDIAAKIVQQGHAIANHTWSHGYHRVSPSQAAHEINRTTDIIYATTGQKSYWFRPPGGNLTNGLVNYAQNQNQTVLMWSVDPRDWQPGRTAADIATTVLRDTRPGGIILLHDGGGPRQATIRALPQIITTLQQQGYEFVTIPTLLQLKQDSLHPQRQLPTWLDISSVAHLEAVQTQLHQQESALLQALLQTSPVDIPRRQALAAEYRTITAAEDWVNQRLKFEQDAKGAWEMSLDWGQKAATAGKTGQFEQAKQHWQQAITTLQSIPARSFLSPQAQAKLKTYQQQLQYIQTRLEQSQSQFLGPIAQRAGLSSQAAISLTDPQGNFYTLRGDFVPKSAASLIKLPLAVVALHWAKEKQHPLDYPLMIQPQNNTEDASAIRVGREYPLGTVIAQMLNRSSNIAPNQLMDTLGWDYINQVIQNYGYKSIKIYSKLVGQNRQPANLGQQSNGNSARDLSRLMAQIYQNQVPHASFLQQALAQQQDREIGFAALQNTQAQWLGEKTGQNSLVVGSIMAFELRGQTYTLAIMDRNSVGTAALKRAIHNIVLHLQNQAPGGDSKILKPN